MAIAPVPDPSSKDEYLAVLQVVNKVPKDSSDSENFEDNDASALIVYGRLVGAVISHVSR